MLDGYQDSLTDKPVVAVVTDQEIHDGVIYETVRTRYLEALKESAGVIPLLLPSGLTHEEVTLALKVVDGLLLTGASSNVAPSLYGEAEADQDCLTDPARDKTAMAAIKVALATDLPLLGICRGLQELNVALGGTLERDVSGSINQVKHTEDLLLPRDRQYDPTHAISVFGKGHIAACLSEISSKPVRVNSLHAQGIKRLSSKLYADACSTDGVVEAVSVTDPHCFAGAVQWHPEWHHSSDEVSQAIFRAFGSACSKYKKQKGSGFMRIPRSAPALGVGFALAAALSNGTVGVLSRKAFEGGMDHYGVAFWRCAIALCLATMVVIFSKGGFTKIARSFSRSWRIAICSALGIFTLYHFETQAFNYASIPLVSILVFAGGIGAIVLDVVILKERITPRKMLAMALVFAGGVAIVAGDGLAAGTTTGVVLSLIAGMGYASFIFAWKFFDLRSSTENFWWFLAYGSMMLFVPFAWSGAPLPSTEALPSLISLGLIPSFLGFFCTILAVQYIEAYKTQVIESSEPLFSATFAVLFFGEWLTNIGMGAALMVILGAVITSLPEKGEYQLATK